MDSEVAEAEGPSTVEPKEDGSAPDENADDFESIPDDEDVAHPEDAFPSSEEVEVQPESTTSAAIELEDSEEAVPVTESEDHQPEESETETKVMHLEDALLPEREPLQFDFLAEDRPTEMVDVMLNIKKLAEQLLYHWKTYPIVLPSSITETVPGATEDVHLAEPAITFRDVFRAPTFDELEQVAMDGSDVAKKLNDKQLQTVRDVGEFEVDSINFPGQTHRWRLSQLLQKGVVRSHNTLLHDVALALRLVIITARNRFHSNFFSLSQGFQGIYQGFWQILDIVIGMPWTNPGNISQKLTEEHMRFLVAELDIKPVCKREWSSFCDYVKDKCNQLEADKHKTTDIRPPPIPYRYQTPKGTEIDLRLFNKDLIERCGTILKDILEKESKSWYLKFKDRMIAEIKDQNLSNDEITEKVNQAIMEEYLRRVYEAILNNEDLENLQPKIGELLVKQAKAVLVMAIAMENVRTKLNIHREEHRNLLIKSHPVKSKIKAWMNEQLETFVKEFVEQNQWSAHEEAINLCRRQQLDQAVYFLQRDLTFLRDRERVLRKELGKVKIPTRVFAFKSRIWLPRNWVIKRHLHGEVEDIPTLVVDYQMVGDRMGSGNVDKPTFTVEKYLYKKTSTRYPFWRWVNYIYRTCTWGWNAMFFLGVVIPWCSCVSFRALFYWKSFLPDLDLSQLNGALFPSQASKTQTLMSRLRALWRNVRESRTIFERAPDTDFLGKAFTRHLNRFWNFGIKGALGSFFLVLVFPPLCLLVSLASITAAVTTPIWMPVATFFTHLFFVLAYDFDHPRNSNYVMYLCEAVLFRILVLGCLQPLGAMFTAVVCLPLGSFFVVLFGVLRRTCRAMWDSFMFHAVIKKRGRVPSSDSFVARRIAGPGLASHYFYQIKPEQALAAVHAQMELHELQAWKEQHSRIIDQPKRDFGIFVKQVFGPFSASLVEEGVYRNLLKETERLHLQLKRQADARQYDLGLGLEGELENKIKLTARELKVTVTQTAKMLEAFYPDSVMSHLLKTEEQFWEGRHLEPNDWQGLATQILSEVFSPSFLTPLEETDTIFKLEVDHVSLVRYLEMLKSAEFRDDLDVVSAVHTPKGDIDVERPSLDLSVFNPSERTKSLFLYEMPKSRRRKPWKGPTFKLQEIEKMAIPPPIPHPAVISVLIHNRENDVEPIDLENPLCQRILRATENVPYMDMRETMADLYDVDPDVSTPDHTTNSEPEALASHLAEQERAFSEDNFNLDTPDSMPDSPQVGVSGHATEGALYSSKKKKVPTATLR